MKTAIPYGKSSIIFDIPKENLSGVLQNDAHSGKNVKKLMIKSLRQKDIPFRKKKALIVVPDATRGAHLRELLPILIEKISTPGRSIDIIIATGLHKKHSSEELVKLLGSPIVKHHKVIQHDPSPASNVKFSDTAHGVPAALDKAVLDHDLIISVGIIEPHLYAGYSGGAKTIAIGLAGDETINATHSIRFLDDPMTNIGLIEGNKFQETLWHLLENIPPVFSVNIVNDQDGKALKIFCGPVKDVFKKGAEFAAGVFEVRAKDSADIAVCGVGHPKDINLYQASRAINYVLNVDRPVIKEGGVIIVAAELKDGIGGSPAEKRFYNELKSMGSPEEFIARARRDGCIAGEHRAYMLAKAMVDHKIMFVSREKRDFMEGLPFKFYTSIEDALADARTAAGKCSKVYIIPHALATIPRLA